MTVNSVLGVTTLCVPLPSRKEGGGGGGRRNAKQPRRVRQLWRRAKLGLPRTGGNGKGPRARLFSGGIGSALRGNLNRVVLQTVVFFKTVERNSVSLFSNPYLSLHVYMYVYFGAKSRTSSNRSEDSW